MRGHIYNKNINLNLKHCQARHSWPRFQTNHYSLQLLYLPQGGPFVTHLSTIGLTPPLRANLEAFIHG